MVWEGVPWFVDGGEHSPEVARLLAYAAMGGREGVVGAGDCKVTASPIPDGNIHIAPGAVACLNRFPGGASQGYLVRNVGDEPEPLDPQGSSGVRYDLVAVIVEDPQYPGQPAPASVPDGPYLRTAVYKNVPAATRYLSEVDADQTGYALARVKFDASDGTVTAADITDLRELLFSRSQSYKRVLNGVATGNIPGALGAVPAGASWAIPIPTWAKTAIIEARWSGLLFTDTGAGNGSASGTARIDLGPAVSTVTTWKEDATAANKPVTGTVLAAEEVDVSAIAGTTQNLIAKLAKTGGAGMNAQYTTTTTVVAEVTFREGLS